METYSIRPAGRLILTIGRDLIQDEIAALMELVKNAYDADSPDVIVTILKNYEGSPLTINVEDHGSGMSKEDIINKWLVPSTDSKEKANISPNGRKMQGRKGIGRYAASLLGDRILLDTTDKTGNTTKLCLDWKEFEEAKYLEDVHVYLESEKTEKRNGTKITILGSDEDRDKWNGKFLKKLQSQLSKMLTPRKDYSSDNFRIFVNSNIHVDDGAIDYEIDLPVCDEIRPIPFADYYDYRIYGDVNSDGSYSVLYDNQRAEYKEPEKISGKFEIKDNKSCGNLKIDIRVYDRETDAIRDLIKRGPNISDGRYLSVTETKKLLDDIVGIGVYRNNFRIRPLGDPENDWLTLNASRVQNPSMRIGSNQVLGYVEIESEENSGLEEKSARDGLKSNESYETLKLIVREILKLLEERRFSYRRSIDKKDKPGVSVPSSKIDDFCDSTKLKSDVHTILEKSGASEGTIGMIDKAISDEESKRTEQAEIIKRLIAMYEGQATLGKIMAVVMHEGRNSLSCFKNDIPNLKFRIEQELKSSSEENRNLIWAISDRIVASSDNLSMLFKKLSPLASKRPNKASNINVKKAISNSLSVFESEFKDSKVDIEFKCDSDVFIEGWESDIFCIITNLVDNSIYWMNKAESNDKTIRITVNSDSNNRVFLDYMDTGPGIDPINLKDNMIFEPQFTTKIDGMGIGLPIAGESAYRLGMTLEAVENDGGAHFMLVRRDIE